MYKGTANALGLQGGLPGGSGKALWSPGTLAEEPLAKRLSKGFAKAL